MSLLKKLGLVRRRPPAPMKSNMLRDELLKRAALESADFVQQFTDRAVFLRTKNDIRTFAMQHVPADGLILEFGVYKGASVNFFADRLRERGDKRPVFGFDSFEGLSEHWVGMPAWKGHSFNLNGRAPAVRDNVQLVTGWVDETLPRFLADHAGPIAFLHIDTDTYTPCKTILSLCRDRLVSGSIVLFDEIICHPGWKVGEFKALNEVLEPSRYEWAAFAWQEAVIVMK